jgi:hypothetical protein
MAYTMIAERNNQKVRKERESALIVLANARVMQSEGWQVVIVDSEGTDFDPRTFEASVANKFSWYEVKPEPVVREAAAEPAYAYEQLEAEALVAAELAAEDLEAAEALDSAGVELPAVAETDFDEPELDDEDADLEVADRAELEDELEEMEFVGEPAE